MAAVAGLQNRGRMNGTLDNSDPDQARSAGPRSGSQFQAGGFGGGFGGVFPGGAGGAFVFDLSDLFGGRPPGVVASGGLDDLIEQFQRAGHGEAAQSWVSDEPNQPLGPGEVEQAISDDMLLELEQRTGMPRSEIVERLARGLPETVNELTPQGRVPTEAEAEHFIVGPDSVELKEPGSDR
jgi:uncharacterized protein YidB (DUF937 family)